MWTSQQYALIKVSQSDSKPMPNMAENHIQRLNWTFSKISEIDDSCGSTVNGEEWIANRKISLCEYGIRATHIPNSLIETKQKNTGKTTGKSVTNVLPLWFSFIAMLTYCGNLFVSNSISVIFILRTQFIDCWLSFYDLAVHIDPNYFLIFHILRNYVINFWNSIFKCEIFDYYLSSHWKKPKM